MDEGTKAAVIAKGVDYFIAAVKDNILPMEAIEGWFGINMDGSSRINVGADAMPVGRAMLGAYTTFRNYGMLHRQALIQAVGEGRMPE